MPDVGAFVETEALATLNAVNSSIEEILTGRKWEFDLRNTGQLTTRGRLDALTIKTDAGSTSTSVVSSTFTLDDDYFGGDYIARVLVDGDSEYAETSFRIARTGVLFNNSVQLILETVFPNTNTLGSLTPCEIHYSEYIMPDTVESIVRAAYQEYPLTLRQVDPKVSYPELFPRPHIEFGPPEIIAVGGFDLRTEKTIGNVEKPGLRMAIWPVPDDAYIIDYSYYYRHPELSAIDDVLDGVPVNVVSRIVDLAAADMKVFYEKDYEALALRRSTIDSSLEMWKTHGGSRSARKGVGNWDTTGKQGGVQRGFPGKLLGS